MQIYVLPLYADNQSVKIGRSQLDGLNWTVSILKLHLILSLKRAGSVIKTALSPIICKTTA